MRSPTQARSWSLLVSAIIAAPTVSTGCSQDTEKGTSSSKDAAASEEFPLPMKGSSATLAPGMDGWRIFEPLRPAVRSSAGHVWLASVLRPSDLSQKFKPGKSSFVAVRLQPGRAEPNLQDTRFIPITSTANSPLACTIGVLLHAASTPLACILPNNLNPPEFDNVAVAPLGTEQGEFVSITTSDATPSLNPREELLLADGRHAIFAGTRWWSKPGRTKGSHVLPGVWLVRPSGSADLAWQEADRFEAPGPIEASTLVGNRAWAASGDMAIDPSTFRSTWSETCSWFTADVAIDQGAGAVTCHPGSRRTINGISAVGDAGLLLAWSDYDYGVDPKSESYVTRYGLLRPDHSLAWETRLANAPLHSCAASLAARDDGSVLAIALTEHALPDSKPGDPLGLSLRTWILTSRPLFAPANVLPDGRQSTDDDVDGGQQNPPILTRISANRYLAAWHSGDGMHWRLLDRWGRIDDTPPCDDGPKGACASVGEGCVLRTCTAASGCVVDVAEAGANCGEGGKVCSGATCVLP